MAYMSNVKTIMIFLLGSLHPNNSLLTSCLSFFLLINSKPSLRHPHPWSWVCFYSFLSFYLLLKPLLCLVSASPEMLFCIKATKPGFVLLGWLRDEDNSLGCWEWQPGVVAPFLSGWHWQSLPSASSCLPHGNRAVLPCLPWNYGSW